jgi:DNA modification methylase
MQSMVDGSVDAIVTDPPYGIKLLGYEWDSELPDASWAAECLRLLKPGAHLVAFAAPRKAHRLGVTLEDAGFEMRDTIEWLQWQTSPKSPKSCTNLKSAHDTIFLARKPLERRTVAANVSAFGTGALNIDACRFPYGDDAWPGPNDRASAIRNAGGDRGQAKNRNRQFDFHMGGGRFSELGRFPANVFHCKKASRKERDAGLEGKNPHDCVKPLKLMRWLVRLVTPPGGLVLDPFAGSGTTAIACALEGLDCVGVEFLEEHCHVARARLRHWTAANDLELPLPLVRER